MEITHKEKVGNIIINATFLIVLNIILMSILGFLTLESGANQNSRLGAILLSFFVSIFIVYKTPFMSSIERLLKFGSGFIVYIIFAAFLTSFSLAILTGLVPCMLIALATLYYGNLVIERKD